ncbi:zinc finger protein ZFP2-like isoform X2 [Linepithema humile]|nr:PREDICTED: zinc finger protein 567-like isoform X2 [Linepithema humile]XP_012234088.1 PREDICTED: zinc finger protein 567-like isoform X2 [Linepithema humile]XP_012234089.1 PREDICTED: zinc finger protein 567-like isoform X2 [Linepithema humile]
MTADSDKDSTHCLVCDSKVGVSTRNSVRIFNDSAVTSASEKPLAEIIADVLEIEVNEKSVHSLVICKKCFKLFNEIDELESRLMEVKIELFNNYKKAAKKSSNTFHNDEEYNDHDYTDNTESQSTVAEDVQDDKEYMPEEDTQEQEEEEEEEEEEEKDDSHVEPENIVLKVEEMKTSNTSNGKAKSKKSKVNMKIEPVQEQIFLREESSYTCLLCTDEDKFAGDAKAIMAHMKEVHETRLYICDICGQDFRKRTELSMHLDDHVAKEEGDFQCEICNRIFSNLRLFRIHKRIHYPQVKSWSCSTCGKKYSSKNLLDEHMNTHTGVRPYVCEVCNKDFASKYTYKAHVKTHELRPRPFECGYCNKTFLSQQNLNQHERTHNCIKEYVCHQCGKAFGSPHNLEVHNIVHTGYKPFICRLCGKAFARKAEIRDHERTHTGEKPYQCEFCGATFSQRSNLQSHKRATHYNDKRYKCDDCGKGFKRRRLLDYHIKAAHTGERPFKCDICTATFVYPEHFKKHRRIHTGEKPYLCEVCGKAFNSRDNRNAHRFIHSDKKPYECLVCGMGFMRKPLLYAHMQTQGHLNDTIVVNQPRLTTEDDQVITIPENEDELLMEETTMEDSEQLDETGLYVTELKEHVIIQQEDDQIYNEEDVVLSIPAEENVSNGVDHLVDGEMDFQENEAECKTDTADQVETVYTYNENEEGETIVVPTTVEDKNVRLVQIRFPSTEGEGRSWLSLVQNT